MGFSIAFLPKIEATFDLVSDEKTRCGQISLGAFRERFYASLSYWSVTDYEQHWRQAVSRIVEGDDVSALVTDMYDPIHANFITCWPMWRVDARVFVQNRLLLVDELPKHFDPNKLHLYVGDHQTENEDGQKISEWSVLIDDMKAFLVNSK